MEMILSGTQNYKIGIVNAIKKILYPYEFVNLRVPKDLLKRANLMCMYIQDESKTSFKIEDLLEILYFDFVSYAVNNYNPVKVLKEVSRKQYNFETKDVIILQIDGKEYEMPRDSKVIYSYMEIRVPRREYMKGQLILDELEALYGYKIPFEVMLSNLLINFIEKYKESTNKKCCSSIVKMLRNMNNK